MRRTSIWQVIRLLPGYKCQVMIVVVASLGAGGVSAVIPFAFKGIVDGISAMQVPSTAQLGCRFILLGLVAFAGLKAFALALNYFQDRQADALWSLTVSQLRQRLFSALSEIAIDYYVRTPTGDLVQRFASIVPITQWMHALAKQNLTSACQILALIVALASRIPAVAVIMTIAVATTILLSWRSFSGTRPIRLSLERLVGRLCAFVTEFASNMPTVRSVTGEEFVTARFSQSQLEWCAVRRGLDRTARHYELCINLVETIAVTTSVAWTVRETINGMLTAGDVVFVLAVAAGLMSAVAPITQMITQAADAEANAYRLVELLNAGGGPRDAPDAVELQTIQSIEFDNVSFSYGTTPEVLTNISFRINRGQTLALVGDSGAGKSTLLKLLLRFYDPSGGRVLVNGRDIRCYTQRSVRQRFGVVLQSAALLNATVWENLRVAAPRATPSEIVQAAMMAGAHNFIERLSQGYDTVVGERGAKLSGGQVQRIAIARAFLRAPDVVVWDEATNALDPKAEQSALEGLAQLTQGRIAILISHRASPMRAADCVLQLRNRREGRPDTTGVMANERATAS